MNTLFLPFNAAAFAQSPCLGDHFYGNYGGSKPVSVFIAPQACISEVGAFGSGTILLDSAGGDDASPKELVWIEEQVIDDKIRIDTFKDSLSTLLQRVSSANSVYLDVQQEVLSTPDHPISILYKSETSALLSLTPEAALSIHTQGLLPPFLRSSTIPASPISFVPVPRDAVKRVSHLLETLRFRADVASLVNSISLPHMQQDIRYLTGEAHDSPLLSRHSFSDGALTAASWLKGKFEGTGASCELRHFSAGFSPNVVCQYNALENTTATVIVSGHYDSRGSFGNTRAPGGNDDGSGTTALLSIARVIGERRVKFRHNVQLVAFAGEEQGLVGSRAYARELRQLDANITLMIQADMLAYHDPNEPAQIGFPDVIGTPEVTQLVANASAIYSPELMIGVTPACCSDHQSFHEQGFPATQVYERAGPILDPMYHNSGDLSDRSGYDLKQVRSIAKVQFATLLHAAGFELPIID